MFPGRDSGLFGTFYELLVGAGGDLFDEELRPAFDSPEGIWAASFIADLYQVRRVTPQELPGWHYDEISAAFREETPRWSATGPEAITSTAIPRRARALDRVGLAPLPAAPPA